MLRTSVRMPLTWILPSLLVACQATLDLRQGNGEDREPFVANGSDSPLAGSEFVAKLEHGGSATCSGSLIHPRLVLTAGHCVQATDAASACNPNVAPVRDWRQLRVVVGQQSAVPAGNGLLRHPGYYPCEVWPPAGYRNISVVANDLALIVLDAPITGVKPGRLATSAPAVGDRLTIVGYGVTENDRERDSPDWGIKRWAEAFVCTTPQSEHDGFEMCARPHDVDGQWPDLLFGLMCICDSGGPTLDAAGAIIGVHSTTSCRRATTDRPAGWPFTDATVAHASNRPWLDKVLASADQPWVCAPGPTCASSTGSCTIGGHLGVDDCQPGQCCGTATRTPCFCGGDKIAAGTSCTCGFGLCEADSKTFPRGACHEGHRCVGEDQPLDGLTCSGCWHGWVASSTCTVASAPTTTTQPPAQPSPPTSVPAASGVTCVSGAQTCPSGLMRSPACQTLTTQSGSPCCGAGLQPCVVRGSCRPCPGYN